MIGTRLPVAFAAGSILFAAAGGLMLSDAPSGATGPFRVLAALPKTDRLDADGDARVTAAFARFQSQPGRDLQFTTSATQAESCLPGCSTIVFKSNGPDQPSRLIPGTSAP